jgi:hypothetical protein
MYPWHGGAHVDRLTVTDGEPGDLLATPAIGSVYASTLIGNVKDLAAKFGERVSLCMSIGLHTIVCAPPPHCTESARSSLKAFRA